jgi:hypothetical protein
MKIETGLETLGTQDINKHGPRNIGYTRYKQRLAWQHWVHKIQTDTGLVTPMLQSECMFVSCVPNVARPVSVFILFTQCCQASVCLYLVYSMLPRPCLCAYYVPNVTRPVSVCILCTQCCQASLCLYLVYPMLRGPCLFVSCLPNVSRRPDNIGYTR